jgi:hypothetical protein
MGGLAVVAGPAILVGALIGGIFFLGRKKK